MTHLCRFALLIGLAACAGGSTAPVGPVPAEAQTATPPPSTSKVKMPPAASLNLLGIAGQVVGVLPTTLRERPRYLSDPGLRDDLVRMAIGLVVRPRDAASPES